MAWLTLLRTRGGISVRIKICKRSTPSSPHARRYFTAQLVSFMRCTLFSARAEVFPRETLGLASLLSLLRTRGDISQCCNRISRIARGFVILLEVHVARCEKGVAS
ncbi:hypothetical protein SAMN05421878_1024 [Actinobaculum suis]|uniref:Uncharacterized protein n=1 Tax=Actinobaculum suis TaxID=1657 RepID=A0A1G7A1R8_9ACTO|nr:hypothetical protein SAMN05421878_1024 [Actinobaculum suis]